MCVWIANIHIPTFEDHLVALGNFKGIFSFIATNMLLLLAQYANVTLYKRQLCFETLKQSPFRSDTMCRLSTQLFVLTQLSKPSKKCTLTSKPNHVSWTKNETRTCFFLLPRTGGCDCDESFWTNVALELGLSVIAPWLLVCIGYPSLLFLIK